jgi:hypothetical protein
MLEKARNKFNNGKKEKVEQIQNLVLLLTFLKKQVKLILLELIVTLKVYPFITDNWKSNA